MAKKQEKQDPRQEGYDYLESYAKSRRTVVLEKGILDALRRAGLKVRTQPVWAERWGKEPVGYVARIDPGLIVERN